MLATVSQSFLKEAEPHLLAALNDIKPYAMRFSALYFPFSLLQKEYRNEFQLKVLMNIVTEILQYHLHYVFVLKDFDIFIVFKSGRITSDNRSIIEKLVFQLRYLFMDDPLAYKTVRDINPNFSRVYSLDKDWDVFDTFAREKIAGFIRPDIAAKANKTTLVTLPQQLNPKLLVTLQQHLQQHDIGHLLRNQSICAIPPQSKLPSPIFQEIFISIGQLAMLLNEPVNLVTERNLFAYLTQVLDVLLLNHLMRKEFPPFLGQASSINLNTSTVLSTTFKEFDATIEPAMKKTILIEINIADIFCDIDRAIEARKLLHASGYRVCIDGVNKQSFIHIDREALGFDLIKIAWNAEIPSQLSSDENKALVAQIAKCGSGRVILCRCDSSLAIDYGHQLGIMLFQGWYLDKALNKSMAM